MEEALEIEEEVIIDFKTLRAKINIEDEDKLLDEMEAVIKKYAGNAYYMSYNLEEA